MYKDDGARWYKAIGLECWVTPELELRKTPGYDYPEDPNILSGSCSLSYSLIDTNESSGGYFVMFLAIFIWIIIIGFYM
jgi:hypothetical protein